MSNITAIKKYTFIAENVVFQLLYTHDTVTNFAASSTEPIIIIGQYEPGNICARPITE
jgi:hypothetical protein